MKQLLLVLLFMSTSAMASVKLKSEPSLKFTGYKFTDKTAVSGMFKEIDWDYKKKAKDIAELLKGTKIKIDSYSIDAGNEARNVNITEGLFKHWGGRYIEGEVVDVNTEQGYAKVDMKIGKAKREVFFQYAKQGSEVVLTSTLDLLQLGFGSAFGKLAKMCAGVHTGADGVTKTWSVVDLEVRAAIK